ncbi:FG-GAP-like repeat-containing protein [Winogradskyella sp. A3E31]|uniref:FG-GAP-like repeat-containing protein n=1 Tax=Winogradskyella sp. A3E31 TaxID=3349637 RepID=UPI00398B84FA
MKKIILLGQLCALMSTSFAQLSFENTAISRGIDFTCGTTYNGNGVSFYDFDGDGWDDISFASEDGSELAFYKNIDGLGFVPINLNLRDSANNLINYQSKQINWVDFDNDGDKDLFVTSNDTGNKLFRNNGNLIFEDITSSAGFPSTDLNTYGASWGDYNNDGFLDVFISNRDPIVSSVTPNYLYKNNGDGTFTDVSVEAGIDRSKHASFCSAWIDINNDGWQDLYISNDKRNFDHNKNLMYKNNGDGTFTDISASSNTDILIDAMTVTVGDYNRDGYFDIYVTNAGECVLLKNNGDETFTDVAESTGTDWLSFSWGAIWLDGENDMDLDLFVSSTDNVMPMSTVYYENDGNGSFTAPGGIGFDSDEGYSHSNAIGDINNDGLVDFVVTNTEDQNIYLWENKSTTTNNWLKVKLQGTLSNKDGIGSVIEISVNGEKQYHYTNCGEGYLSQNSSSEFFGIGTNTVIDYIKVTWLSGIVDVINNVSANQLITVVEGNNALNLNDKEILKVELSPNPAASSIKIKSPVQISKLSIYNVLNQNILNQSPRGQSFDINIENLKSGLYLIILESNEGLTTKKFIKK